MKITHSKSSHSATTVITVDDNVRYEIVFPRHIPMGQTEVTIHIVDASGAPAIGGIIDLKSVNQRDNHLVDGVPSHPLAKLIIKTLLVNNL